MSELQITSNAFENKSSIPVKYSADGENINPSLEISNIPENVKSLVLINDDPDAQKVVGYTWIHWLRFNIPVDGEKVIIEEDSLPGISGKSTYKKPEYGGPSPPAGTGVHNYYFKFYALDIMLDLPEMASQESIEESMKNHVLAQGELVGTYTRD